MAEETLGIRFGAQFVSLGLLTPSTLRTWADITERMNCAVTEQEERQAEQQLEILFAELAREFKPPQPTQQLKPSRSGR